MLFHLSFVIDCMDGKIARLNGTGSVFGAWLDYVFDRLRVLVCTVALMGGQYARTGDFIYVWLGGHGHLPGHVPIPERPADGQGQGRDATRLAAATGEGAERPVFLEETGTVHPAGATPRRPRRP